jgi:hypothetical protein
MKAAEFVFDWRLRNEIGHDSYPNLILVKLKGECLIDPSRRSHPVRGPLALSHTTRTAVMRFADIQCDAVSSLVRSAAMRERVGLKTAIFYSGGRWVGSWLTNSGTFWEIRSPTARTGLRSVPYPPDN